jgi:diguanylate cyclase (GGDEF)-like protein/PAS domain S-box-containing protein
MWSFDTLIETGTRWLRATAQGSTLLGVLMIGLVWTSLSFHLEAERSNAERAAVHNSDNLARAFEEHLSRSIKDIDRSIKIVRTNYLADPERFALRDWLKRSQFIDDQTLQVSIIGPDGFVKSSSIEFPSFVGIDLGDREHFRVHVDARNDELFISKPVIGRVTGKPSIQLTRRIENGDGSFGGVIVASLDPTYLARFYSSVDVGIDGYVRIVGVDGIIRAAGGRTPGPLGRDLSEATLFKHYPKDPAGWYYATSVFSDNISRIVTYRKVKDFPLIVTVGFSTTEIFSGLYAKKSAYNLAAAILTALILAVIGFSIRGRLALDRASERLRTQNRRFNAVLTNMPLGVCMFDSKGRLAVSNDRYVRMYGLPAKAVEPGTTLREILRYRKANGTFSGDVERFCDNLIEQLARGSLVKGSFHLNDGRFISASGQPMDGGGWVSIHEDTTEQQLAKRRLEQTKRFLDTVIENVPAPIVVKEPDTQKFVLVNQAYEAFVGLPRDSLIGRTVFELFPSKDAELIAKYDNEAVQFNKRLVSAEFPVETPANGMRVVTTTRLVVGDGNEKPQYLIAVIEDVTEKKKTEAKIAYMAHHDPLTGLFNRAQFTERLDGALTRVRRGEQLAVLFLDLDQFKQVNDTRGHLAGDELLKAVADRLRGCVREIDTVARLGGDEFAIIQTAIKKPAETSALADRIRAAIKAPYDFGDLQAVVGVSIGISHAPHDATASAELMKRADLALYKAKGDGRDMYRFFEPEMDARITARRKLEADLRNAIVNSEFELFYQPVVNIQRNEIVGVEGLLRWHHPEHGTISPAEFIPLAEETGLIVSLGEWVIRQACSDAANWPTGIKIAVNLSPAQFRSQNLAQVVISALAASGVPPCRLELEITEEMLFEHNRNNLAVLEQLRELGVQIVMDDFGIGYSSLNYLRSFQFDKIKIDRSFVNDLSSGSELSLAIVQAVARLASVLKVPATAEGIETKDQLELVRAAGCTEFQGYLFSPPKPAEEIARLFQPRARAAVSAA